MSRLRKKKNPTMFNGTIKTLGNVKHLPKIERNMISFGFGYSTRGGVMKVTKSALLVIKGEGAITNLYKLIGEIHKVECTVEQKAQRSLWLKHC